MRRPGLTLLMLALVAGCVAGCAGSRDPAPAPPSPPVAGPPIPRPPDRATPQPDEPPPAGLDAVEPVVLPAPPWAYTFADPVPRRAVAVPRLVQLAERPNEITDEAAWLARYGLETPGAPVAERVPTPAFYRGALRQRVMEGDGYTLAIYGEDAVTGRYVVGLEYEGGLVFDVFAYDLASYLRAPAAGAVGLTEQGVTWAALEGDRLYVQTNHMTYAETSGGLNGYVTALDARSGELLWRSRPLVANARTFEAVGDVLVVGYGFTAEPDHLYVLDRFTGEVRGEARLRTAPEWIVLQGGRLLVRAYDTDYEFALR